MKKLLFLSLLLIVVGVVSILGYQLIPSEAQRYEARRIDASYNQFKTAMQGRRWATVLEAMTPNARKQLQDDIYRLLRISNETSSGDLESLQNARFGLSEAKLQQMAVDKQVFDDAINANQGMLERVADAFHRRGGEMDRSISWPKVDPSLRTATCTETVQDDHGAVSRTLHFARIDGRWRIDRTE